MNHISRIRCGNYTDSDIGIFYITDRYNFGPFVREVGDFLAHPTRDKGVCFDAAMSVLSQISFFQCYQSSIPMRLEPSASCEWWFRPYLERKAASTSINQIKQKLGMSRKELVNEIASWFDNKERYPLYYSARDPFKFFLIVKLFSSVLEIKPALDVSAARGELTKAFRKHNISPAKLDEFLVGTIIALNRKEVMLYEGVVGKLSIGICDQSKIIPKAVSRILVDSKSGRKYARFDGSLCVNLRVTPTFGASNITSQFMLLDTQIDTRHFFAMPIEAAEISADGIYPAHGALTDIHFRFESAKKPQVG